GRFLLYASAVRNDEITPVEQFYQLWVFYGWYQMYGLNSLHFGIHHLLYMRIQMHRVDDLHLRIGMNDVQERIAYVLERLAKAFSSVPRDKDQLFGGIQEGKCCFGAVRGPDPFNG